MKILVLGCGLMGPTVAKDCVESKDVAKVTGCDINEEQLKRCSQFVANKKFETSKLDITDHKALLKRMKDFDVVVNAAASRFSLNILKAATETGVNLVDLSGAHYPLEGELHVHVKKSNITVIPDCGVDPGLADILAGHGMGLVDEVEDVSSMCGGLPRHPVPPLNYKIVFGGKKMPIQPGKVPVILNGKKVEVNRYDDVEPVHIEGFEEMEAFYDEHSSSLLNFCMEKGVKTFQGKTIRYRGFIDTLRVLQSLGTLSEEPVVHHGQEIVPLNFFHELVYPAVRFDREAGDRDVTILLVRIVGKKGNSHMCITYEMVDFYDEEKGITSMARTTGYTAAIIARMLARGDINQKGIHWPVHIIKGKLFEEFMKSLKKRGIEVTEKILKRTEL